MGSTFGGHEIQGIAVCPKDHVTGVEMDDSIQMDGTVVEELGESLHGSLGAMCRFWVARVPRATSKVGSTVRA